MNFLKSLLLLILGAVATAALDCKSTCKGLKREVLKDISVCNKAITAAPVPKLLNTCIAGRKQAFTDNCIAMCASGEKPLTSSSFEGCKKVVKQTGPKMMDWCRKGYESVDDELEEALSLTTVVDNGTSPTTETQGLKDPTDDGVNEAAEVTDPVSDNDDKEAVIATADGELLEETEEILVDLGIAEEGSVEEEEKTKSSSFAERRQLRYEAAIHTHDEPANVVQEHSVYTFDESNNEF